MRVGERVFFDHNVGRDASTVFHRASVCRAKSLAKRIGQVARLSVSSAIFEVVGLDAASGGDVVFGRSELHHGAVGKFLGVCTRPLP